MRFNEFWLLFAYIIHSSRGFYVLVCKPTYLCLYSVPAYSHEYNVLFSWYLKGVKKLLLVNSLPV